MEVGKGKTNRMLRRLENSLFIETTPKSYQAIISTCGMDKVLVPHWETVAADKRRIST